MGDGNSPHRYRLTFKRDTKIQGTTIKGGTEFTVKATQAYPWNVKATNRRKNAAARKARRANR